MCQPVFDVQTNRVGNVRQCFRVSVSLGVTALQNWAGRGISVPVLFDEKREKVACRDVLAPAPCSLLVGGCLWHVSSSSLGCGRIRLLGPFRSQSRLVQWAEA